MPTTKTAADERLSKASVAVVGIEEHTLYALSQIADAGIGTVTLIDDRKLSAADVHAASFFFQNDEGKSRISAARDLLAPRHEHLKIELREEKFDAHNAEQLLGGANAVIEGFTNWQDKTLASDVCMQLRIPLIHAGLHNLDVQVFCMVPSRSACLRCVFAKLGMEDFATVSTTNGQARLGSLAALAGSLQALECIKLLGDIGTISPTRLMKIDALRGDLVDVRSLTPRADCPDCGKARN